MGLGQYGMSRIPKELIDGSLGKPGGGGGQRKTSGPLLSLMRQKIDFCWSIPSVKE